jgi:hypothetical protein
MSEYFSSTRTVYWPSEYLYIANMMQGKNEIGDVKFAAMYKANTFPVIVAAIIGLIYDRQKDLGPSRGEILTETFENQKYNGYVPLAAFLLLIPVLAKKDTELLRPENENELLRLFEKYAAGGFEYLGGLLSNSTDPEGETTFQSEINKATELMGKIIKT